MVGYTGTPTDLAIPSQVEVDGTTYPVTAIGDLAFMECTSLASVSLAESVTRIGEGAFQWCYALEEVSMPGVVEIGYFAFETCTSLEHVDLPDTLQSMLYGAFHESGLVSVHIPDSVTFMDERVFEACGSLVEVTGMAGLTEIPDGLFCECTSLREFTVPAGVTSIVASAFEGCTSLEALHVERGSTAFVAEDGVLFTADMTSMVVFPSAMTGSYTVPDTVTGFADKQFHGSALEHLDVGDGVTSIGPSLMQDSSIRTIRLGSSVSSVSPDAFDSAASLTSIEVSADNPRLASVDGILYTKDMAELIRCPQGMSGDVTVPDGVTAVGRNAFQGCSGIVSVSLPDGLETVGSGAFSGCTSLASVDLPDGLLTIGDRAFSYCSALTGLAIPDSVTSIGTAVAAASGLTSFTVPAGVTHMDSVLSQAEGLTSLEVSLGNRSFAVQDGVLYDAGMTRLIFMLPSFSGDYVMPDTVTSMASDALLYYGSMTSIRTSDSLTELHAWKTYSSLRYAYIGTSVSYIGSGALTLDAELEGIEVSPDNPHYVSVDGVLYSKDMTVLYAYPSMKAGTTYVIPDTVTEIAEFALNRCQLIEVLDVPASVTAIGHNAMYGMDSLEVLVYRASGAETGYTGLPGSWGEIDSYTVYTDDPDAFSGVDADLTILPLSEYVEDEGTSPLAAVAVVVIVLVCLIALGLALRRRV